jgi:hypothetical protein
MVTGLSLPRSARAGGAQTSTSVALVVRDCPELFEQEMRDILGIELGELLLESSEAPRAEINLLEVDCEPTRARVRAMAPSADRVVARALPLDAFPGDAAPRAVALAGVEALSAVNPTLSERLRARQKAEPAESQPAESQPAESQPAESAAPPAPAPPARDGSPSLASQPSVRSKRHLSLSLGALHRRFLVARGAAAWGGRAELSWHAQGLWRTGFDADLAVAERSVTAGRLRAVMVSSGAWLGVGTEASGWSVGVAAGARAGLAQLRGEPTAADVRGHEVLRPWAGPVVLARASASLGRFEVAACSEGGMALLGAEGLAQDVSTLRIARAWLALSLNGGIVF